MTIGSNNNDVMGSAFDFDLVTALEGDDTLNATHNGVILLGGDGNDTMTTTHTLSAALGSQSQLGGEGDDSMAIDVDGGLAGGGVTANLNMDGGNGNDNINADFDIQFGDNALGRGQVTGGRGNDTLRLDTNVRGANSAAVESIVVGGRGRDTVTFAGATSVDNNPTGALANARLYVDLGGGLDRLDNGFLQSQSAGNSTVQGTVLAGSGFDEVNLTTEVASGNGLTGGRTNVSLQIDGGDGGDLINSSLDSNFGVQELDEVLVTDVIDGGVGADTVNSTVDLFGTNIVDYDATIDGGDNADMITVDHDFEANQVSGSVDVNEQYDLGSGNDSLSADMDANATEVGSIVTDVTGSDGAKDIDITGRVLADRFAVNTNVVTLTGTGNDDVNLQAFAFVRSAGAPGADHVADARNTVTTADANDTVTVSAQAQSSGDGSGGGGAAVGAFALNFLNTGRGNDIVDSGTFIFSDSNDGTGLAQFDINAGGGSDTVVSNMSSDFSELFEADFLSNIVAGTGNDMITSTIDGFARNVIDIESLIFGEVGNDTISSTIITESFGTAAQTVNETVSGGIGDDLITTVFDSSQTPGLTGSQPLLVIEGNEDNDTIDATIIGDKGTFDINGGDGNDLIMVSSPDTTSGIHAINGGNGNDTINGTDELDDLIGGAGQDRVIASAGDDFLFGGTSSGLGDGDADTFVFDPGVGTYDSSIRDFEAAFDIIEFTGLADTGPAGLLDDFDALGTFTDPGAGGTVQFDLFAGGNISFAGVGTGAVNSFADLVNDVNTQLIA